jgi:hypothetical protein
MKKLTLIAAVTLITIAGCKSTPPPIVWTKMVTPLVGEAATTFLGENLITQGHGYYTDVITVGDGSGWGITIQEAKYFNITGTDKWAANFDSITFKKTSGKILDKDSILEYNTKDNKVCFTLPSLELNPFQVSSCFDSSEVSIEKGTKKEFAWRPNKVQKYIEYNGKSGDTLKFTYREFTQGGMARDAFRADFTMDLNEGNTMGYKGARFEVIKATNSSISYKIIKPFI